MTYKSNIISEGSQKDLSYRVKFEQLINYISNQFSEVTLEDADESLNKLLQSIGEFEKVDRSYIFLFSDAERSLLSNTHEWCAPGIESQKELRQNYQIKDCSNWFIEKLNRLEIINISHLEELEQEQKFLENLKSLLVVPIVQKKTWIGFVGFDAVTQAQVWTDENIMLLQVFAEMLSSLWQRQKNEKELYKSKRFLASLVNSLPGIVFSGKLKSKNRIMNYLSAGCFNLTGYKSKELIKSGKFSYQNIIHPLDLPQVIEGIEKSLSSQNYEIEYRIFTKTGEEKWLLEKGEVIEHSEQKNISIQGFISDISQRKAGEIMILKQAKILEMIAKGSSLEEIFNQLIKSIEKVSPHLLCSIMLVNSERTHLRCHPASSVHPDYIKELQAVPIGENKAVCGAAAFSKEKVIISDLISEPNCLEYKELFLKYELRAAFSIPIISSQGDLFGTFTTYYHQPKEPSFEDLQLIKTASFLVGIAIEGSQVQERLKQTEAKYRSIFENAPSGIFQRTVEGNYISANPALLKIYGYQSITELSEKNIDVTEQIYVEPNRRKELIQHLEKDGYVQDFESQIYRADGSKIWISENTKAIYSSAGHFLYYEGTIEDITKRHQAEEQLIYQVHHDSLTGLFNRIWLMEKLTTIIEIAKKQPSYQYALLFIDLDGFKLINDSLGHTIGDKLLKQVAQKLETFVNNQLSLARLNSDEFVILIENFHKIEQVIGLVQEIQKQFILPFHLNKEKIFTNVSIGIALSKPDYQFPEQILQDADIAMYQAKSKGTGTYAFFSPIMQNTILNRVHLETDLRGALEREEFIVYYQPIILLTTGRLMGFEALIRWNHPRKGFISPNRFVPILEETGLIKPVGMWLFRQACQQIKEWKTRFSYTNHLTISVNLSIYQFKQPDFLEQIKLILQEVGIESRHLKLEITESAFMESASGEMTILQGLKDLGIQLCIDDFGTGYSSLSRLHELPISTLKIDQAFVRRLDAENTIIIETIITLAHVLNMTVIAEGIEKTDQLELLSNMQCEMGQGYLFSRPVNAQMATTIVSINLGNHSKRLGS